MAERVTVIVPVWNAEDTVEAAVRSVLDQSHRELRLLAVDDGSTDGSAAILSLLAEEDGRVEVLRLRNGGPAAARNRALERLPAGTDYVLFLDADDRLPPDAVSRALEGSEGAPLTLLGFSILQPDGSRRDYCQGEQLLDRAALRTALPRLYQANLLNQVWGKLFAASLLRDLRFPDRRWGEDRLFLFDALERAEQVKVLPIIGYHYLMHRGESLVTRYYEGKFDVCCEADRRMEALCPDPGQEGDAQLRTMFTRSVFSCLTNLYSRSCPLSRAEKRAAARRILNEPRVRRRCRDVSGGLPARLLCAVLRSRSVGLNLLCFRLVARAGERFPALFTRMKHKS